MVLVLSYLLYIVHVLSVDVVIVALHKYTLSSTSDILLSEVDWVCNTYSCSVAVTSRLRCCTRLHTPYCFGSLLHKPFKGPCTRHSAELAEESPKTTALMSFQFNVRA